MSIRDIEADESPEQTAAHIGEMTAKGHVQFEARHRRKSGEVIHVEVSVLYVPSLGNRLFAFVRDISKRKEAEAELELYHQHLERLVEERTASHRSRTTLLLSHFPRGAFHAVNSKSSAHFQCKPRLIQAVLVGEWQY